MKIIKEHVDRISLSPAATRSRGYPSVLLTMKAPERLVSAAGPDRRAYLVGTDPLVIELPGVKGLYKVDPDQIVFEQEGSYQQAFKKAMKKYGISKISDLDTPEEKKGFFNYVDSIWKAKDEKSEACGWHKYGSEDVEEIHHKNALAVASAAQSDNADIIDVSDDEELQEREGDANVVYADRPFKLVPNKNYTLRAYVPINKDKKKPLKVGKEKPQGYRELKRMYDLKSKEVALAMKTMAKYLGQGVTFSIENEDGKRIGVAFSSEDTKYKGKRINLDDITYKKSMKDRVYKLLFGKVPKKDFDIKEKAVSRAQQAAIAISKKERGEKPKKEVAPPGREKQVKGLKKAIKKGEINKTYVDKKTGKRMKANPFALAWAQYDKHGKPNESVSENKRQETLKKMETMVRDALGLKSLIKIEPMPGGILGYVFSDQKQAKMITKQFKKRGVLAARGMKNVAGRFVVYMKA